MNGDVQARLAALRAANSDVTAAAIATTDGFPVASAVAPGIDEEALAALAADLLARAGRSSREFGNGELEELYARGPQGFLVIMRAGAEQVLIALAKSDTTVGLLLRDVRKAAAELA